MSNEFIFPETLGECADLLYEKKQQRLELQREVARIEAEEKALKARLIEELPKSNSTGIAGVKARVSIVQKDIPTVEDWSRFYSYVEENKCFELLQKRLSDAAIKERWENGEEVPGVAKFTLSNLSLNKL